MTQSKLAPTLQPHPLAKRIPLPTEAEYEQVRDDIAENGQRLPIVLYEGLILDGRTRYRACRELGVEPEFRDFDPDIEGRPALFVVSMNLALRSLTEEQKIATRQEFVADLRAEGMTNEAIARALGISEATVRRDQKRRLIPRPTTAKDDKPTSTTKTYETSSDSNSLSEQNRHGDDSESAGQSAAGPQQQGTKKPFSDSEPGTAEHIQPRPSRPSKHTPRRRRRSASTPSEPKAQPSTPEPEPQGRRTQRLPSEPEANGQVEEPEAGGQVEAEEPLGVEQLATFYEETRLGAGRFKATKLGTSLSENQMKRLTEAHSAAFTAISDLWRQICKDYGTTLR